MVHLFVRTWLLIIPDGKRGPASVALAIHQDPASLLTFAVAPYHLPTEGPHHGLWAGPVFRQEGLRTGIISLSLLQQL
jgi:hypothetical protein